MPRSHRLVISATEFPHFRRLVAFVEAVDRHADSECDVTLQELVHELRDDLASLWRDD